MSKSVCKLVLSSVLILSLLTQACKKDPVSFPTEPVPIELSSDQKSLIGSENSFAVDIFKKTISFSDPHENILISPLSISSALSMTLNGAHGTTRDAMLEALRFNGLSPEIINQAYKDLTKALMNVDERVLITIANSVWTRDDFVVKKPFIDILSQYYSADGKTFNISDPNAEVPINTWISLKTNGLIKNMIDKLDGNTVMLLINAIYFKGKWEHQFDKANTVQQAFYKSNGTSVSVPMMKQTAEFKIYNGDGFTVAEFPYGQGNYVMDAIIPTNNNTMAGLFSSLSQANLDIWINQMTKKNLVLSLPRFKYGYKKELKDILSDMGMGIAFSDNADLSNIADMSLIISSVRHQAFIETNEEGTVAAAATVVIIGVTANITPTLTLDHPFIYIIRETNTNSIIFMGKVEDPAAN